MTRRAILVFNCIYIWQINIFKCLQITMYLHISLSTANYNFVILLWLPSPVYGKSGVTMLKSDLVTTLKSDIVTTLKSDVVTMLKSDVDPTFKSNDYSTLFQR